MVSGMPNCANNGQKSSMVTLDEDDVAGKASIHLNEHRLLLDFEMVQHNHIEFLPRVFLADSMG